MRAGTAAFILATTLLAGPAVAANSLSVFSSSSCACCAFWVRHMQESGYETEVQHPPMAGLYAKKTEAGLSPDLTSCHTAFISDYVIEGHVPAAEVDRLLAEKPDAIGLTVPGMPADAPGMGSGDTPYEVLLVKRDGSTEVYARYPK